MDATVAGPHSQEAEKDDSAMACPYSQEEERDEFAVTDPHSQEAGRWVLPFCICSFPLLFFFPYVVRNPCPWMVLPIQLSLSGETLSQTHPKVCLLSESKSRQADNGNQLPHI